MLDHIITHVNAENIILSKLHSILKYHYFMEIKSHRGNYNELHVLIHAVGLTCCIHTLI